MALMRNVFYDTIKSGGIMKKIILLFLCIVCLFSGCDNNTVEGGYTHPDFKTEYTIEEHIGRIEERTRVRFEEEIASGELVSYNVDIIYAFYDNDSEYFLVELEYAQEHKFQRNENVYISKNAHFIGYIENDEYYVGIKYYDGSEYIMAGRSAYSICGFDNGKKFYGGLVQAVETSEGIIQIYNWIDLGDSAVEFGSEDNFVQRLITESEQEKLMRSNFKLIINIY